MEWYFYPVLIIAGLIAGFINTLAGNGSIITLPLLLFLGLPANVANGTNRIGILLQSAISSASFKQQKIFDYKEGIWFAVPATFGSLIGAIAAVNINSGLMERFIGAIFFLMFFLVLFKPEKWIQEKTVRIEGRPKTWQIIIFFLIGIYGGFIQAGVGLMLLAALVLGSGVNLTKANALKVFVNFVFTFLALFIFIINGQISYVMGSFLAIGSIIGGFIGSKVAIKSGPKVIRIILLVILFISALKYLGAFDLVIRIFS
jgi:uncharacterized protein